MTAERSRSLRRGFTSFIVLAAFYELVAHSGFVKPALMPPLGVVGFGLATWNLPILGGALALVVTNFLTIALAVRSRARG